MKKCLNLIYIILLVSCTELASVIPMTVSDIEQNSYKANRDSNRVSIHDYNYNRKIIHGFEIVDQ